MQKGFQFTGWVYIYKKLQYTSAFTLRKGMSKDNSLFLPVQRDEAYMCFLGHLKTM